MFGEGRKIEFGARSRCADQVTPVLIRNGAEKYSKGPSKTEILKR